MKIKGEYLLWIAKLHKNIFINIPEKDCFCCLDAIRSESGRSKFHDFDKYGTSFEDLLKNPEAFIPIFYRKYK